MGSGSDFGVGDDAPSVANFDDGRGTVGDEEVDVRPLDVDAGATTAGEISIRAAIIWSRTDIASVPTSATVSPWVGIGGRTKYGKKE